MLTAINESSVVLFGVSASEATLKEEAEKRGEFILPYIIFLPLEGLELEEVKTIECDHLW